MPIPAILASLIPGIIGAGASAIGSMMQGREDAANQEAIIRAQNKVTKRELRRQNRYNRNAADVFTNAVDIFSPERVENRMAKADRQTTGQVTDNLPTDFGSIGTGLAPAALGADEAAFVGKAADENARHADTLGQLLSHDQYLFNNDRALAKTGHKLGRISDFARGSANVANIERAVAGGNVQPQQSIWGPILQAGGTIGSYLAGQGGISLPTKPLIPNSNTMY